LTLWAMPSPVPGEMTGKVFAGTGWLFLAIDEQAMRFIWK
jgi:hypothetical protein